MPQGTCNGEGYLTCYCQGDHCGCGFDSYPQCTGCVECDPPPTPSEESLFAMEPGVLYAVEMDPRSSHYGKRRPMIRATYIPTAGEIEERRGHYGD